MGRVYGAGLPVFEAAADLACGVGSVAAGYRGRVINAQMEDHLVGLELELVELVEQHERATVQGQPVDAARIQRAIDLLQEEMARTAEAVARPDAARPTFHDLTPARSARA